MMKQKYNIALVPQHPDRVVKLSTLFKNIADTYLLGKHSYPHVTLCQFQTESEMVQPLFHAVLQVVGDKPLRLHFHTVSYLQQSGRYWISLLPNEFEPLSELHAKVTTALNESTNPSYDPHMTLCNTLHPDCEAFGDDIFPQGVNLQDSFTLILGECDDAGQITRILMK